MNNSETLIQFADMIDNRLEAISGRTADGLGSALRRIAGEMAAVEKWQSIDSAPKDGTAFLAYGRHDHSPADAQHGVVAGDHWWAIILWDVWRDSGMAQTKRWVFAKDGAKVWSDPLFWQTLEIP